MQLTTTQSPLVLSNNHSNKILNTYDKEEAKKEAEILLQIGSEHRLRSEVINNSTIYLHINILIMNRIWHLI